MNKMSIIAASAMALLLPATAPAQTMPAPAPAASPGATAAAGPGMALARFQQRQAKRVLAGDKDADGRVSLAEFTATNTGPRAPRMFKRMDSDGDGFLTRAEIDAELGARFARLDADGNGALSKEERTARRAGARQQNEQQGEAEE